MEYSIVLAGLICGFFFAVLFILCVEAQNIFRKK